MQKVLSRAKGPEYSNKGFFGVEELAVSMLLPPAANHSTCIRDRRRLMQWSFLLPRLRLIPITTLVPGNRQNQTTFTYCQSIFYVDRTPLAEAVGSRTLPYRHYPILSANGSYR